MTNPLEASQPVEAGRTGDTRIRPAVRTDLPGITAIYNHAIAHSTATFDTAPRTEEEQQRWFARHGGCHPLLVAEQQGAVVGWAALSPWSERCAYATTVELSIYVAEKHQGQGLGARLMEAILSAGEKADLHLVISRIAEGHPVSIRLHEKYGFCLVGTLHESGYKFGRYLDVIVMEKLLDGSRK